MKGVACDVCMSSDHAISDCPRIAEHEAERAKALPKTTGWESKLARAGKDGDKYAGTVGNAILVLANHKAWRATLAFDEFACVVVTDKSPPWDEAAMPANPKPGPWADADTSRARAWFEQHYPGMKVSRTDTDDAVRVVAQKHRTHPVREFLEGLKWDGAPRLDTWTIRLGGAPDTRLVRAQSSKWLISAVARIQEPGCQVDHVLVVRGPQDAKKTSALRRLAMRDEWFHDEVEPVSKDGKIGLAGVWIALDDEFAGLRGGNERKKKSFISRRHEKYRSPYDKWDQRHARQCVLAAAVNEEEILSDPTGGRRYWIIDVRRFDIEALVAEREQLWAEAVHRYRAREKWYLDDQKLVAAAARTQEAARARDAWEQPVAKWLGKKIGDGVTTHDVLRHCIFAGEEHMAHSADEMRDAELRIANVLRTLGWAKCDASRNRRGHLRDGLRVRLFFEGGKCPKCTPGSLEREERGEEREKDGHPGHSLGITEKKRCPPLDSTLDTPGHPANGTNGAGKPAHAAPLDSLTAAKITTSPRLTRERGRRKRSSPAIDVHDDDAAPAPTRTDPSL
jgi:predicted P-loop ATPase